MMKLLMYKASAASGKVLGFFNPTLLAAIIACAKIGAFFAFLVLIRLSTPRPRLESVSRSGWLIGLALLAYVAVVYGLVFIYW